jgi:hypothetical protein
VRTVGAVDTEVLVVRFIAFDEDTLGYYRRLLA